MYCVRPPGTTGRETIRQNRSFLLRRFASEVKSIRVEVSAMPTARVSLTPSVFSRFRTANYIFAVLFISAILCTHAMGQNAATAGTSLPQITQPLITQPIDESQLTTLRGNTHPLARPQFDLGTAPASLPMERMLLVLKRSPEQETALRTLLDNQQDKHSPSYHKWLTPEQFGKQFGPTDSDIQIITGWLQSHGFQVGTTKGRTVLEFSGSASQVQEAFHTAIHKYIVNGEQHWANASDPQIPTALVPAVKGVLTLHNFISKPQIHVAKERALARIVPGKKPQVTFPPQNGQPAINALAPQDFAVIYNIVPVYNSPNQITGASLTIGVVGRSDLYNGGQDVSNFYSAIGVGNTQSGFGIFNVIYDGPDPGDLGGGEEAEATLDTTWSSAIAPGATVYLVVSGTTNTTDGITLSEQYIVENDLADIMTESFSTCEYYATDAQLAGITALAEQAAAQGITYFVSTGDDGAEGCDDPSTAPATGPVSVNALASTAFNIAVGGTEFNENGDTSEYWTSTPPMSETAISYIPEDVWNESSLSNGLWSGSGGASAGNIGDNQISPPGTTAGVPKPSWQSGTLLNIPSDGVRDLPDIALTAASHDPYLLCLEGSCVPNDQGEFYVYFVSGTSAAAPSFAGIMALVVESQGGVATWDTGRQGQANYVLYPLAQAQATQGIYPSQCNGSNTSALPASDCIFHDVTVGNNVVPGETGNDYQAGPGYDLTTGLGSANVANLVSNWNSVTFNPTTTTLTLNGGTDTVTITHGQSVNVAATVAPNSGTATPTGNVALLTTWQVASPLDLLPLSGGQAIASTSNLPGSGGTFYSLWAHYSGDGTYAPSSSVGINVTVNPEPSTTTLSLQANSLSTGNLLSSPYAFGSLVFVQGNIAGKSGQGIPTGTVTFTDTFGPLPTTNAQINPPVAVVNNPPLNSQGNTSIGDGIISFDAGNHTISAVYSGDASFNGSSSTQSVSFTVQPGFAFVSLPSYVNIASPGMSGTAAAGIIASTGFSTAVSFTCSGLPTGASCGQASVTGQGPNTVATANILVTTTAASTTSHRASLIAVPIGALPLAGIVLLAAPRHRRGLLLLGLVVALLVFVPSCGGGGGGSTTPPPSSGTPTGNYTVTVTATAGASSQSGTFTLVVQ